MSRRKQIQQESEEFLKQATQNNNVHIAKFMGATICELGEVFDLEIESNGTFVNHLEYHKNWKWAMSVVEKIRLMKYEIKIEMEYDAVQVTIKHPTNRIRYVVNERAYTPINAINKALVEFINYYNDEVI